MSYTLKNIYKKPADNPDLEINFWGSDILTLIDTFFDAGKITQKPVKSNDGLFETYTTIFKDKASFDEFIQNNLSTSNKITLELWCAENGVICSNEHSES